MPPRPDVDTLIDMLRDPRRSPAQQDEAVRQLSRDREQAIPALIAQLKETDVNVRGRIVAALGRCGSQAIPALRAVLDDPDPAVRAGARMALGLTRSNRAVRPVIGLLANSDADVRRKAAVALGWLGNDYAEDALLAALEDKSPAVRDRSGHGAREDGSHSGNGNGGKR